MISGSPLRSASPTLCLVQAWTVPKAGHTEAQNEDAFAVSETTLALADGATETAFARAFARHLVAEAVRGAPWTESVAQAQAALVAETAAVQDALPWYAVEKQEEGAAAALLRVTAADGVLDAEAVGDACVLVEADGAWQSAWPLVSVDAFSHRPTLLHSVAPASPPLRTRIPLRAGLRIAFATDALAAFLLALGPSALPPAGVDPAIFVAESRARGLRNDDTTLVLLAC